MRAPASPAVRLTRSHAYRLLGRPDQARLDFQAALRLPGEPLETWVKEYRWLVEHGESHLAGQVFARLMSGTPGTPLEWSERALALVGAGDFQAAVHDLARAGEASAASSEFDLVNATVIDCLKKPVRERRWSEARSLIRAYNPSHRAGATTVLEAVLERIEASLMILCGEGPAFTLYARTIVDRPRVENHDTLAGELALACNLAPQDSVPAATILRLAEETIARRPPSEVWWRTPRICGLIRAGQYENAIQALDDVLRMAPEWSSATNDVLRAMAHHQLGHAGLARDCLGTGIRKMSAPAASGSAWTAWAGEYVQDALLHETLTQEAVSLIYDPVFPRDPFGK